MRRTASAVGVGTTERESNRRAQRPLPAGSPTAEAWIRDALDGYCAACGRGPWRSVMGHVVRAHGLSRFDLANAAGISSVRAAQLFTSEMTRAVHAKNSAARWPSVADAVVEAGRKADHRARTNVGRQYTAGAQALRAWRSNASAAERSSVASAAAHARWSGWSDEERAAVVASSATTRRMRSSHGPEFVAQVKSMRAEGKSQREIGVTLGVSQSYVSMLLRKV